MQFFPVGEIQRILVATGRQSQRIRKLSAELMVYWTVACGLFVTAGGREVLRRVLKRKSAGWIDELEDLATESALTDAEYNCVMSRWPSWITTTVRRIRRALGANVPSRIRTHEGPSTIEVTSVGELLAYVAGRIAVDNRILWFRGHRSRAWTVAPAIWRGYHADDERNFTNRFRSRAATRMQTVPRYDDSAYWLSLMQHYGLPTRLLDWSRSPLIAAYFAVEEYIYNRPRQTEDACIWILEPHSLNMVEGFEDVTPSLDAWTCLPMLSPAFTHRDKENGSVLAAMAAERDQRMFVQQGCFTIHSARTPLNLRRDRDMFLTEVVIPAHAVRNFAVEVDVAGFRKGDIFPDLSNLADELKAIYPPRT